MTGERTRGNTNGRQNGARDSRVPPHDLDAEESLLGAALIAAPGVIAACPVVDPGHFYKPAHGHIWEAILRLHALHQPVDPVTVADELRRDNLLDLAGGPAGLAGLVANVPATSSAPRYAEIVLETSELRDAIARHAQALDAGYDRDIDRMRSIEAGMLSVTPRARLQFVDLGPAFDGDDQATPPDLLARTDGACLAYTGELHWAMGEHASAKTWLCLLGCVQVMEAGGHVVYCDWEDNHRRMVRRLMDLGLDPMIGRGQFHYLKPGALDATSGRELGRMVSHVGARLAIFDGVAKALNACGLDEDNNQDVLTWLRYATDPVREAGAAVICLDHVNKDKDTRGRYARGAGAKINEVSGAAWSMEAIERPSRQKAGKIRIKQAKDRDGWHAADGDTVAILHVVPLGEGRLTLRLDPPGGDDPAEAKARRPTIYMERVSRTLEGAADHKLSKRQIRTITTGDNKHIDRALDFLLAEGHIAVVPVGRYEGFELVKEFRQEHDPGPGLANEDPGPDAFDVDSAQLFDEEEFF